MPTLLLPCTSKNYHYQHNSKVMIDMALHVAFAGGTARVADYMQIVSSAPCQHPDPSLPLHFLTLIGS
ncbi:hypothetical protein ROHU_011938 [Labeo rohita]|uniref:Uncharacterized protein n=1 Tax=Labeo rohita TaxID=84645 RepID=A0A498LI62_LABRO|nr:hypothetical protein ROHU_011938 [Labeo rohita]